MLKNTTIHQFLILFKVILVPSGSITFVKGYSENSKFLKQLEDLSVGTTLYHLRRHLGPDDKAGLFLDDMVTTDKWDTSLYGDTNLFFKHQYIDDNKKLRPESADDYDKQCTNELRCL